MDGAKLLDEALSRVESESIREWASSAHNRPIWEKIAQGALDKSGGEYDPNRLCAYLVCVAIGA
jgi:hypothetical protein